MENCIFCKIVKKEIPSFVVYEDENYLAFLDINPESPGHAQVIPKKHYRWVWDLPSKNSHGEFSEGEPNIEDYFNVVHKIALAQRKAFKTDFILSKIVGDEIPHAHIWVFPNSAVKGNKKDLAGNAEKIKIGLIE